MKSLQSPKQLADAFSEFIAASSKLEGSYRNLQREVGQLGTELAERNAALTRSLAENEAMRGALQQIIDSMPCGVLVMDTAERIVTINPEGRELLQLGDAVVRGLQDVAALSSVDLDTLAEEMTEREICIAKEETKRWLAISHHRLSGGSLRAIDGAERYGLRGMWILRDVTANKEAEREREAARNAMALAEVSAILAHEIRNPLASMELFAGLLMEDRAERSVWVSHLRAGIRLLSATVNNVLSLHGGMSAHRMPMELSACFRESVEFVRPIAEQAGVRLSFRGEEELKIQGNESQLRQVLLNLVCNAIRHTPSGGEVTVVAEGRSDEGRRRAVVAVSDTGCGISEDLIGRVFDVGFSARGDTSGLGLAVCKRVVEGHEGSIRVISRVSCGSRFEMEFCTL
jgi:two-component system sensor histidine kinase FlrB